MSEEKNALEWKPLPNMPEGKWEPMTVVIDDRFYAFGGYGPGVKSSKKCFIFDPKDASWTQIQDLPSAVGHANLVLDGRCIWFAGGFKDGYPDHVIQEVWCLDLELDRFIAAPLLPKKRGGGGLGLLGRKLHFVSGIKPDRDTDSGDHWVFDPDQWAETGAAEWVPAAPIPVPRNQFSAVVFNGELYAIGGQFHHDSMQLDQPRVDIYNPETDSWRDGPALPKGHSHSEGATFVYNNRIYLVGGHTTPEGGQKGLEDDILSLAPGGSWELVGKLPKPLSSPAATIIDGRMVVAGGYDGKVLDTVWAADMPSV